MKALAKAIGSTACCQLRAADEFREALDVIVGPAREAVVTEGGVVLTIGARHLQYARVGGVVRRRQAGKGSSEHRESEIS